MGTRTSRRGFLAGTASGAALLGLSDLGALGKLRPVSAEESRLDPKVVRLSPEIEPLVRLLEETPRDHLLEEVGHRVNKGLSYRDLLAALLLAGVRNVQPRPAVGFKFHAVLVVNSAHLASLNSPPADRWLPIFWALDEFKSSQARDVEEGDWTMRPVDEAALPKASQAGKVFAAAMDHWDEPAADAAVAALARSAGAQEVFDVFCRYGARDFRSIGHKAIYVANSWRTLGCIGWHHNEPVLRSLAYALLMHDGERPDQADLLPDRPWRENQERAGKIRGDWLDGQANPQAAGETLAALRSADHAAACELVVELLNRGVAPQSIWDGLFSSAGELLARRPGIVSLHAVTTTNALRFAFEQCAVDETRRLLLLQNTAFLTFFRDRLSGELGDLRLDTLEPQTPSEKSPQAAVAEIFATVNENRQAAAAKALGYLSAGGDPQALINAARVLVFLKGDDSHDYKFSSAVLEDYGQLAPQVRDRFLAASLFQLRGSGDRDNPLVGRIRAALG